MKTGFILGAGASRDGGAPLVNDFLDRARRFYSLKEPGIIDDAAAFEDVFNCVTELRPVYDKSHLDLDNIEDLFATIETGLLIGKLANRTLQDIEKLRSSIITLIVRTIERSVQFTSAGNQIQFPPPYYSFLEMLRLLIQASPNTDPHTFSFITFNYDIILDIIFTVNGFEFDYCLNVEESSKSSPFLKLHGSINWGFCEECRKIIPFYVKNALVKYPVIRSPVRFPFGSSLDKQKHCNKPLHGPPVLVPPTWNKMDYQAQITNVWKRAAIELGQADNIVVIGYSLPKTDTFFHYLFALGSESNVRIRKFIVINPDIDVKSRFENLLGSGVKKRYDFQLMNFRDALNYLHLCLQY